MKTNKKQSVSNTRITNLIVRIMTQRMIKLVIAIVLFCGCNFTIFAETLTVRTITEALNYSGNNNAVTKLIITDSIAGNDYSVESEWRKFRTLDETFPNIEAVEILTDQDIPDFDETNLYSLFCWSEYVSDIWMGHYVQHNSKWLKYFSAPNMKSISSRVFTYCENLIDVNFPLAATIKEYAFYDCSRLISIDFPLAQTIGHSAFWRCSNLTSINFSLAQTIESMAFASCGNLVAVDFPLVQTIGYNAFNGCYSLTNVNFPLAQTIGSSAFDNCSGLISVDFPLVQTIGHSAFSTCLALTSVNFPLVQTVENYAFYRCNSLVSVSFGTAFKEETEIIFKARVFLGDNLGSTIRTGNINLTLGKYVLPKPNLSAKVWQNTNGSNDGTSLFDFDYIWKSITVKELNASIEEVIKNRTISVYPNPTNNTLNVELENYVNNGTLTLFDMSGKIMLSQAINGNSAQINMSHLTAGNYILRLVENGTASIGTQVIKQ